jgi:hypothetical protein
MKRQSKVVDRFVGMDRENRPASCDTASTPPFQVLAGKELEQIEFLLGHPSVQTTERYLGCKQKLSQAGERQPRTVRHLTGRSRSKPTCGITSGLPVISGRIDNVTGSATSSGCSTRGDTRRQGAAMVLRWNLSIRTQIPVRVLCCHVCTGHQTL